MTIDYDNFYDNIRNKHSSSHGTWYWILATQGGRRVLLGPKSTEQEAYQLGYERLPENFEVVPLPTRDRAKATSMLKARGFEKGDTLEDSLKRYRHKVEEV